MSNINKWDLIHFFIYINTENNIKGREIGPLPLYTYNINWKGNQGNTGGCLIKRLKDRVNKWNYYSLAASKA